MWRFMKLSFKAVGVVCDSAHEVRLLGNVRGAVVLAHCLREHATRAEHHRRMFRDGSPAVHPPRRSQSSWLGIVVAR